jgi:hypothetical protein
VTVPTESSSRSIASLRSNRSSRWPRTRNRLPRCALRIVDRNDAPDVPYGYFLVTFVIFVPFVLLCYPKTKANMLVVRAIDQAAIFSVCSVANISR